MATNTELIQQIGSTVTTLVERVDSLRRETERIDEVQKDTTKSLNDLKNQVTTHDARLQDLIKDRDNRAARNWQVWLALIGSVLALAVQVVLLFAKGAAPAVTGG